MTHITVCICTYKRPQCLARLLDALDQQETNGLFSYSIVVADNDFLKSAKSVVTNFADSSAIPVRYCIQPCQNIALTRNTAIENSQGDFVAFIDDDEFPIRRWLLILFQACQEHRVDGVLGPVKRHFDEVPPQWIIRGQFYERPSFPTGTLVEWPKGRTGNFLVRKSILKAEVPPFRPQFRAGEDKDFFRRMIDHGYKFIWCDEAIAFEVVPPSRWRRTVMLRRALLRGATTVLHPTFGLTDIAKSLVAVPVYAVALPFASLIGHHRLMMLLVKLCDHLGKLLAVMGFNPIKEQYVTD